MTKVRKAYEVFVDRVIEFMKKHKEGATSKQVTKLIGMSPPATLQLLALMIAKGHVFRKRGYGVGGVYLYFLEEK